MKLSQYQNNLQAISTLIHLKNYQSKIKNITLIKVIYNNLFYHLVDSIQVEFPIEVVVLSSIGKSS